MNNEMITNRRRGYKQQDDYKTGGGDINNKMITKQKEEGV